MQITCGECRTSFRIDPAKVPPAGIRARCSACGGVIPIGLPGWTEPESGADWASPEHVAVESDAEAAPEEFVEAAGGPTSAAAERPTVSTRTEPIRAPATMDADDWWGASNGVAAPEAPAVRVGPAQPAPPRAPASVLRGPAVSPARRATSAASSAGGSGAGPVVHPPAFRPLVVRPAPTGAGLPPGATPAVRAPLAAPAAPAVPAPPAAPMIEPVVAAVPAEPGRPPERRINPFLRSDPHQKARRLANALVSDILAYHPAELATARAAGTLREALREEIQKSYEEYVDQVGRALAESTPYFRDALNTMLAEGRPVF